MQVEEEEDDLDAYMRTLDVPSDFLPTKPQPQTTTDVQQQTEEEPENVITLEDLKQGMLSAPPPSSELTNGGKEEDDKFYQALMQGSQDAATANSNAKEDEQPSSSDKQGQVILDDGLDEAFEEESGDGNGVASAMDIIMAKAKKKEIKPVDHSKMNYPPFRKNFYVEGPDVQALTDEQIKEMKEELEITVRGRNPPRPITNWEECGLSQKLLETILKNGWEKPFAIQRQAIPAIMSGRDVMGVAQTGSGKTLAYLVPLLRHVKDQPSVTQGQGPIALIIAPTRELATQIQKEVRKFQKALGVDCACLYGGQNVGDQIRELKKGVAVVVGTPGRLIDILSAQGGRTLPLSRVTFVVLDEADRLFDMGFTPQVERILKNVRPDRQTVMFSATFPPHVEKLAKEALKHPLHIIVGNARSGAKVSSDVTQIVELWKEDQKFLRLLQLLGEWYSKGNVLIFCDSQVRVDSLYHDLERAGYPALTLHAGKDQLDRDDAIKQFKNKTRTLMVATGVAGRGLDVPDLNLVVNFNCPNHLEEYVHRVGRTGRAGRKGTAVTFVAESDDDKYASDLIFALKASEQAVPAFLKRMADEFESKVAAGTEKKHQSGYKTKGYAFEDGADDQGYTAQVKRMRSALYEEMRGVEETEEEPVVPDEDTVAPPVAITSTTTPPAPVPHTSSLPALDMADPIRAEIERKKAEEIAKAKALAAGLNVVPGRRSANPSVSSQPSQHGMQEIDINDLPAVVRQKLVAKRYMNQIENEFKVSLTVKGQLFPAGHKPGPKDQKLTMMVEAPNIQNVRVAVAELNRFINQEAKSLSTEMAFEHVIGGTTSKYRL